MMFEVGSWYENNFGKYQVIAVTGDQMIVQYKDGHRQSLSVKLQEQIITSRQARLSTPWSNDLVGRRVMRSYRWVDGRAYQTVGFLLKRVTRLGANLTAEKAQSFKEEYRFVKGVPLTDDHDAVSFLREGANQWGNQGVIRFRAGAPELSLLSFSRSGNTPYASDDQWEVKDMSFLFLLLGHGFDLGSTQDEEAIRRAIPPSQQVSFEKGVEYGLRS